MLIGNRQFGNKTHIVGILNLTPDSFSDGGSYFFDDLLDMERVIFRVLQMIDEGAEIIDIGGESTRPGHVSVSAEEEIKRVIPSIREIRKRTDIPISVDTQKASVAALALEEGADLINDINGFKKDKQMAEIVAKHNAACCLMHNRENNAYSGDIMTEIKSDLAESVDIALRAGVDPNKIMLDPGIGFAKDYGQNLEVLRRLSELKFLNYPLMLAASRKSVVGNTLSLPANERLEGTLALSVLGIMAGCEFIRVHDIKENKRAIAMTEAVLNKRD